MRALIDSLQRLLSVPDVKGVALFAPNGATYCARLDQYVAALESVARLAQRWFNDAGSELRYLELRTSERRLLWFRAGRGILLIAANPNAHVPTLASRIALSIVSLVDAIPVDGPGPSSIDTESPPSPFGAATIPAPASASKPSFPVKLPPPVVTFVGSASPNEPEDAFDGEEAKRRIVDAINALSALTADALGGPVRRNYLNRARKAVARQDELDPFEIDLCGTVRCHRLSELDASCLGQSAKAWCEQFVELVSVIEPAYAGMHFDGLVSDPEGLLERVGFLRKLEKRSGEEATR